MSRAIIDADSYMYRAAISCKELIEIEPEVWYEAYILNNARNYLRDTMKELTSKVGCSEYVMVTGGSGINFRKVINPSYKSNRKQQQRPIMLEKVKAMCMEEFPMCYIPHLEADDTCRILLEENKDNVVVSIDKDLRTFSGKIYDSYHDAMRFITPQQAEANFKRQLLIGDTCDGYSGIKGVGKATADKLLIKGISIDEIAQMYIDNGLSLDDFKMTYNCAKIIGSDDYDNGVVKLYG